MPSVDAAVVVAQPRAHFIPGAVDHAAARPRMVALIRIPGQGVHLLDTNRPSTVGTALAFEIDMNSHPPRRDRCNPTQRPATSTDEPSPED
jgi:hypothetical protein